MAKNASKVQVEPVKSPEKSVRRTRKVQDTPEIAEKPVKLPKVKPMLPPVKVKPARPPKPKGKPSPGRKPVTEVNSPKAKRSVPDNAVSKRGGLINGVGKDGKRMPAPIIEENFAAEYLVDLDGQAAYLRVCPHVAPQSAKTKASELLTRGNVQAHIKRLNAERLERTAISADKTLMVLAAQAFGDRRELTAVHVGCCRYCWGKGGRFQYSDGEFADARAENAEQNAMLAAADKPPIEFNEKGGPGYMASRDPNPECAICAGDGEPKAVVKDTRKLSDDARVIFDGSKQGKTGVEVNIVNRQAALTNLMRHQGLFEADNKVTVTSDSIPPEVVAALSEARAKAEEKRKLDMEERARSGFTGD